jgi:hypothetical protein
VWEACPTGSFTAAAALGEGRFVFAARSVTIAGPDAPATRPFTVDLTAPAAPAIQAPLDGATVAAAPLFAFTGEAGATLACSLDAAPFAPCVPGATFAFAVDAAHSLVVRATDAAGNTGAPSPATRFATDVTAPTTRITSPGEGEVTGRAVRFAYAASEPGVTYRCRLDLGRERPCGDGVEIQRNLPPGVHRFRVGATDALGHVGPMVLRTFRVSADPAESEEGTFLETGAAGATGLPGVRRARFALRRSLTRAQLARRGLRIAFEPGSDTRVVRIRVLRLAGGRARPVLTTVRAVRGSAGRVLVLRTRAIRRLRPGRHRVELRAGPDRTRLGPPGSRTLRVVR